MSDEPDDYDIPLEGYELSLGNDLVALHGRFKELEAKLDRASKMLPRALSAIYKDRKQEAIDVLETTLAELTG